MMKIKAPLIAYEDTRPLCEAGAEELFCGYEPYSWRRKNHDFMINQRPTHTNIRKRTDLKRIISLAHEYNVKVHVAVNGFFCRQKQYTAAEHIIDDIRQAGADGVIVSDPALMVSCRKHLGKCMQLIAGCGTTIFNAEAVLFFKSLGVGRIVIPRAMTTTEIQKLSSQDTKVEYEVFIMNDLCFFIDGFCAYCKEQRIHYENEDSGGGERHFFPQIKAPIGGCRTPFMRRHFDANHPIRKSVVTQFQFWDKKMLQGCGACALYDFHRSNIHALKILDRNLSLEERLRAVSFIVECRKEASLLGSREKYNNFCKALFKQTYATECTQHNCYYPSGAMKK